jgi:hypothetical protein
MYQLPVAALLRHAGASTTHSGADADTVLACTLNGTVQHRQ